jgi:hypothetical protein
MRNENCLFRVVGDGASPKTRRDRLIRKCVFQLVDPSELLDDALAAE